MKFGRFWDTNFLGHLAMWFPPLWTIHLRWWWLVTAQFPNHKVPAQLLASWRTLVMQSPLHPKRYSFWYHLKDTTELKNYADCPTYIPNYPITPSSGETTVSLNNRKKNRLNPSLSWIYVHFSYLQPLLRSSIIFMQTNILASFIKPPMSS